MLISQRNLPIAFKRFYIQRSLRKVAFRAETVNKIKFEVSKVIHLYSFKYINRDIEKYVSPLSMVQVFGNENKVLCVGKRHVVELDMSTGKVKDVSSIIQ